MKMLEGTVQLDPDAQHRVETFGSLPKGEIETTLQERGRNYGDFPGHARITQGIKREMAKGKRWDSLRDDQKECLEMVAHKIGRILNGDPDYKDSWHDIVGYVKLVDDTL